MVLAENSAILSFYKLEFKSPSVAIDLNAQIDDPERLSNESANDSVPHIDPQRAKTASFENMDETDGLESDSLSSNMPPNLQVNANQFSSI